MREINNWIYVSFISTKAGFCNRLHNDIDKDDFMYMKGIHVQ